MHRWEIIIGIIHAECQKWPIKGRVVKLLLIIESFKIQIDFHLKWHPFGVPWKINGGISEWTAGDYLASSLQPFFRSLLDFPMVENTEIFVLSRWLAVDQIILNQKTDFRMRFGFHEEYQKCKIHKKIRVWIMI